MNDQELESRYERREAEPLIVSRVDGGFRVHTATNPARIFRVTGIPDEPRCTCSHFENHAEGTGVHCTHVLAVLRYLDEEDARYASEERAAIQTGSRTNNGATTRPTATRRNDDESVPTHMTLKRSVSPDGRIDSLSVEFACPVADLPVTEIKSRALSALWLQSTIVSSFLEPRSNAPAPPANASTNGGMPARLLDVGGMTTRYGRRLFINVEVNGGVLKLFGNRKKLAEAITASGYPELAEHVEEGLDLDVPCRVQTKPSDDGRYVNVDKVFPAARSNPRSSR